MSYPSSNSKFKNGGGGGGVGKSTFFFLGGGSQQFCNDSGEGVRSLFGFWESPPLVQKKIWGGGGGGGHQKSHTYKNWGGVQPVQPNPLDPHMCACHNYLTQYAMDSVKDKPPHQTQ